MKATIHFAAVCDPNPGKAAAAAIVTLPGQCHYAGRFSEHSSSNLAAYVALIEGLRLAARLGATQVEAFGHNKVVVECVRGTQATRVEHLLPYQERAQTLLASFEQSDLTWIPKTENLEAVALANKIFFKIS